MDALRRIAPILVGLAFGFALHRVGFADWAEVHAMFTFADLRLFLGFMLAVVLLAAAWQVIARLSTPDWKPRPFHPGIIPGGLLFGAGWALCGVCPGAIWVQLGAGKLIALVTLAGMLAGNYLYPLVHARFFRFTPGSCSDR